MNCNIKQSDCIFYVNEETRTIVCKIPNTDYLLINFINDNFCWPDMNIDSGISWRLMKKLSMPSSFIGKAVCAPEDEWNEELGRMLAFSRAKDKCYKSFFKRANLLVQTIDKRLSNIIEEFNNFGIKLSDRKDHLEQSIKEKIGEA